MQAVLGKVVGRLLALIAGFIWGFFVAFNMVFSDIFGSEMLWAIVYVAGSYFVLGAIFGCLGRTRSWRWTWWLSAPGLGMVAIAMFDAPERYLYTSAVIIALVAGSFLGSLSGSSIVGSLVNRRGHGVKAA